MKKMIALLMTAVMLFSFAACGNSSNSVQADSFMPPEGMPPDGNMRPGGFMPPDGTPPDGMPPDGVVPDDLLPPSETDPDDGEVGSTESTVSEDQYGFTKRDYSTEYELANATRITLSSSGHTVQGTGASVDGKTVVIVSEGVYYIKGSVDDARVTVSADKEAKIQLIFDGVSLKSADGPAVYIASCDKVFLTLAKNSINIVSDASTYTYQDGDSAPDAAIFSREDLTINAEDGAKLTLTGSYKHGIVSKDDLVITGGKISVTAKNVALSGKDAVKIGGGEITLTAGSDGIRATNTEDTAKGYVYLNKGTVSITSGNDGIQAETALRIDGGALTVTTGSGAPSSSRGYNQTESKKGLKAGGIIEILGGEVTLNCEDDAIHTNNEFAMHQGTVTVSSGDDGVHADVLLTVANGKLTVEKSYEGLEGQTIHIKGGTVKITSSDDGINASSGSSNGNDFGFGGFGGGGGMQADTSCEVVISGGYLLMDASGDGLDSNGYLKVTGGTVLVAGPTNSGNGALDYGAGAEISGGTLIALGASGMAEGFKSGTVGSFLTTFSSQSGGKSFAVKDASGNVIASVTAPKSYNSAVVASSKLTVGETYTIVVGGTVVDADENGFASSGTVSGGDEIKTVTMTSLTVNSGGMGGGMGGGGGGRPR